MPVLLFRLNGVPEDEAAEVRALLAEQGIDYYETHAGNWGFSTAAIWLRDELLLAEARALLDAYQTQRALRVRQEYVQSGRRSAFQSLWWQPGQIVRLLVYLAAIALVAYLSLIPFLNMWK
jgi:hypothetical protein